MKKRRQEAKSTLSAALDACDEIILDNKRLSVANEKLGAQVITLSHAKMDLKQEKESLEFDLKLANDDLFLLEAERQKLSERATTAEAKVEELTQQKHDAYAMIDDLQSEKESLERVVAKILRLMQGTGSLLGPSIREEFGFNFNFE